VETAGVNFSIKSSMFGQRSGLENREYGSRNPLHLPRDTLYPQKLALTSPISGGRSVGIVRSRTEAKEFIYFFIFGQRSAETWERVPVLSSLFRNRRDCLMLSATCRSHQQGSEANCVQLQATAQ
jgi:hypothetical protein